MPEPLATPADVAGYLRKSEKTLANWRSLGIGPPYVKAEGGILYDWAQVRAWVAARAVRTAS